MDALQEAELSIKRAHEQYAEHPTVSALELQFAQAYTALAQAAALTRIADALERACPEPEFDPRQPGQSWDEYHQEKAN